MTEAPLVDVIRPPSAGSAARGLRGRIAGTAAPDLTVSGAKRALATLCIGVGQGIAPALERAWTARRTGPTPIGENEP